MNLWVETIETLRINGKEWKDVLKVGTKEGYISKELFEKLAKETDYYDGFGACEIAEDLIIEGKGFRMIRGEYDGSEWWKYIRLDFIIGNKKLKDIKVLSIDKSNEVFDNNYVGWQSLKELNTNNL